MSRSPEIWLRPEIQNLTTKVHDHEEEWRRKGTYIDCQDPACRKELLLRGGVECVKMRWFVAKDRTSFSIPQPDGSQHTHEPGSRKHKGECTDSKCEHDVVCSSPTCNQYFQREWQTWLESSQGQFPSLTTLPPVASPTPEQRPKTVRQLDEERAALRARALENAAIEQEVRRINVERFQPNLR